MTANPTTPKRWRPRFSLRTLVILVTLVCCYAACWVPTRDDGIPEVEKLVGESLAWSGMDTSMVAPLIIAVDGIQMAQIVSTNSHVLLGGERRRYYFWFFGYVAKLPYERDMP